MKNMEVIHTLRLYRAADIGRLGVLMDREQKHYRNKNEFLTAVLMLGCDAYAAADAVSPVAPVESESVPPGAIMGADTSGIYTLLAEMNAYILLQFKALSLYHGIEQKLLSAVYRMLLSLVGGERALPSKLEQGFYDDLPARFDKIIAGLRAKAGDR
jgi:hypothetical protein